MKKRLRWLDDNLEKVVCVALMTVMTVIIVFQVIMRYVFQNSLTWSEEFVRYCFIWLVCIGASYGCKKGAHIKIDAALKLYPKKLRKFIVISGDLCVLILAAYILTTGIGLVGFQVTFDKSSPAMGLPLAFVNSAPVAGFALIMVRQIQNIWRRIHGLDRQDRPLDRREGK